MAYKCQNPHLGPGGVVETFDESSWPNDRVQLGYIHEKGAKRWQCFKVVDATASSHDVLYVKNYASYEATPTIANSSNGEVAGVLESAASAANVYKWLRQGGPCAVKANGVFLRGVEVWADTGNNRVIPGGVFSGSLSAAADTAGAIMSVTNPATGAWRVTSLIINRTTASSGAGTADFGIAANATTLNDGLIDGLNLNAAAASGENNFANAGTNGKASQYGAAGTVLTGSTASGNVAGLVGTYSGTFELVGTAGTIRPQVLGRALGALGADVQNVTTAAGEVAVDLDILPLA